MTKSLGKVRWCAVGAMSVVAGVLICSQITFSDSFSPIADVAIADAERSDRGPSKPTNK